jgi:SAM-dependent methyltransferase
VRTTGVDGDVGIEEEHLMTITNSAAPTADATAPDEDGPTGADTFHHGAVSRFNAWFFRAFDRYINHITARHKTSAFAGIDGERIVELGAGVGANFDHLPHGSTIVAVEPNEAMHDALRLRAEERGVILELVGARAERLPLPDASVDEVICSLVLCTVDDPDAAVDEVRRVLRPGGRFRFVEHVAAPSWSPRRWLQHVIRRPWSWVFEGCDLCRDTGALVELAGFSEVELRRGRLRRSAFVPVNTVVSGVAVR